MNQEIRTILKKTVKVAGAACFAAGAIAVLTSGAALKAIGEGGRYLVNTVQKIVNEKPEVRETPEPAEEDAAAAEEAPACAETV